MIRRVGVMVLIGVMMAGCGLSPRGTVKVDGDEYAKAVNETESLGKKATDLIRETSEGTDGDISAVLSSRCGEPYADNLRTLGLGSSFRFEGSKTETQIIDSVADGLVKQGWKKKQGENERYFFEHGITGGATMRLFITPEPDADEPGQTAVNMSFESTCMRIPKDIAEKS
ncbi:hypothetical protein [Aeromicrobium sp. Root236]|uniref:hypothetical protein n=1 Tax=Aeromicrobium sp. Root236 TaxID=1736498 RepID=UPI0012F788FF|nr:hypothetical protein [Aeromicrobium sp. Root236]